MKSRSGFTIIELMIVVTIVGILAVVAIPKFALMLEKAKEGATKGNIGALKSAISMYNGDNRGAWPGDLGGWFSGPVPNMPQYMDSVPPVKVSGNNPNNTPPHANPASVGLSYSQGVIGAVGDGWCYDSGSGFVWVNSSLLDISGVPYSTYGY